MSTRTSLRNGTRLTSMILAAAGAALLSGCAATVALEPAPDAVNPGCAEIMVRLPQSLPNDANNDKRETNAQATAAWGDPASVLLRCGITPTGPTTLPCININGIDWIEDDSGAPNYRFITYGRVPTTEVIINNNVVSGTSTLVDLTGVISNIPQTSVCLDVKDVPALPTSTPVPSP